MNRRDYIACIKWPKESIEKINQLKRTFLWKNVLPKISVDCLVACDRVILPKINGGLGDRNLTAHNDGMLCKFLCKVLQVFKAISLCFCNYVVFYKNFIVKVQHVKALTDAFT